MLPDMSYNPLRESGSGEDDNKVRQALKMILEGRGGTGAPEFGSVAGSAEHKALMMLGGNTGRFAGNYAVKNYDKLDPMVKELIPLYGEDITEEEGALEKQKDVPALPRLVESARKRQQSKKQPSASFVEEQPFNFQEGGPVPVDGEGNMPPEAVAGDVINGAPVGMVDVPGGGGPTDDGVPTKLPEGSFVLNAAAIQYHGTKTINDLINNAVRDLLKEGVQISMEDPNPEDDVPVAISNGEYVIPPEVAEKIGIKKLEDMNERGLEYRKKQDEAQKKEAEAQQQQPQPQETFMGLQMPPETPQQAAAPAPAPVQSEQQAMATMGMADGGPISKAKDAFVNWFTDTFLGGPMIPTNESVDALLGKPEPQEPQKPPMLAPSATEQKQEGGFIGQPMSPQQQPNMAISNPYGFSLDNPFSQQPSFIGDAAGNIVGSKKKSRIELADGTFLDRAAGFVGDAADFVGDTYKKVKNTILDVRENVADRINKNAGSSKEPESFVSVSENPARTEDEEQEPSVSTQENQERTENEEQELPTVPYFTFEIWRTDYNADKNMSEEQIAAARKRFDKYAVSMVPESMIPEAVRSEVNAAVQKAGNVFDGDSGFSSDQIQKMLLHTGYVESQYLQKVAQENKKVPDERKARSYWQVEPTTAHSLLTDSKKLLGTNFEREFSYLLPENSNQTVKKYLESLFSIVYDAKSKKNKPVPSREFLDILTDDPNLGATFAMGRYIQAKQDRIKKNTQEFR